GAAVSLLARRGVSSPLLTAAIWVVAEAIRGRFPVGGFAWADVGIAFHDIPAARAVASVGGVPLVSFLCVALAGFLVDAVLALRTHERRPLAWAAGGAVVLLVVAAVADITRYESQPTGRLRVAVLQGDDRELSLARQQDQLLTEDHLELASH